MNIFCILSMSFLHRDKILLLFQICEKVDHKLQRHNVNNNRPLYYSMVIYHIILFTLIAFDYLTWSKSLSFEIIQYYVFRYVQYYHLFNFVMLEFNLVLMIRSRLRQLKLMMLNVNTEPVKNDVLFVKSVTNHAMSSVATIKHIGRTLSLTTDIVHMFNKTFGWNILLLNLNILMGLLSPISLAIVLTRSGPKNDLITLGLDLTSLCMIWGGIVLLLGVIVAASCDYAIKEARGIGSSAYKILQDLPEAKLALNDDLLREELLILGQQATLKCPKFSAAGFFYVDFTMLYNILGSVTTYVVVIVQFNN